jgi:hypothetical protein
MVSKIIKAFLQWLEYEACDCLFKNNMARRVNGGWRDTALIQNIRD